MSLATLLKKNHTKTIQNFDKVSKYVTYNHNSILFSLSSFPKVGLLILKKM